MTKDKITTTNTEEVSEGRRRQKSKKVYERVRQSHIPDEIRQLFLEKNYDLKPIRWAINGVEQLQYLNRREQEGYEFVDVKELPEWYVRQIRLEDTRSRNGLVTLGDLCLMKIDRDLRQSRRAHFDQDASNEVNAVDIHVLEKKGFRNLGTRSKTIMREPTFSD